MRLSVKTTKSVIAPQTSVYLEATLTPPEPPKTGKPRKPVAIVLVFDRSGSMGQVMKTHGVCGVDQLPDPRGRRVPDLVSEPFTKIACVRAAAERMVDSLSDSDYMGIVSFTSTARVEIPLTQISPASRTTLVDRIRRFQPGDTTNIEDGLDKAFGQFSDIQDKDLVCKVILLSDGIANVGCSDPDGLATITKAGSRGKIVVSTLGVGEDYQAGTMTAVAQAGQGEFYHIREAKEIEAIVAAEVVNAQAVTAKKVSLEITVPATVAIGNNLNGYPQDITSDGVRISIGDLAHSKTAIAEVSMPVDFDADNMDIEVSCAYEDVNSECRKALSQKVSLKIVDAKEFETSAADKDLGRRVGEILSADAILRASIAYEGGGIRKAVRALQDASAQISSSDWISDPDKASATSKLDRLRARISSHSVSRGDTKVLASMAYGTTRSRKPK